MFKGIITANVWFSGHIPVSDVFLQLLRPQQLPSHDTSTKSTFKVTVQSTATFEKPLTCASKVPQRYEFWWEEIYSYECTYLQHKISIKYVYIHHRTSVWNQREQGSTCYNRHGHIWSFNLSVFQTLSAISTQSVHLLLNAPFWWTFSDLCQHTLHVSGKKAKELL